MNDYPIDMDYLKQVGENFDDKNHPVLAMLKNLHAYTFNALVKAYDWYTFGKWQRVSKVMQNSNEINYQTGLVVSAAKLRLQNEALKEVAEAWNRAVAKPDDEDRRIAFLIAAQRAKVASQNARHAGAVALRSATDIQNSSFDLFKDLAQTDSDMATLDAAMKQKQEPSDFPPDAWTQVANLFDRLKEKAKQMKKEEEALAVLLALLSFYLKEDELKQLAAECLPDQCAIDALKSGNNLALQAGDAEDELLLNGASLPGKLAGYQKLVTGTWGVRKSPYLLARLALASRLMELCHDDLRNAPGALMKASFFATAVPVPTEVTRCTDFPNWLFHALWRSGDLLEVRTAQHEEHITPQNLSPWHWKSAPQVKLVKLEKQHDGYGPVGRRDGAPIQNLSSINDDNTVYTTLVSISNAKVSPINQKVYEHLLERTSKRPFWETEYKSANYWSDNSGGAGAVSRKMTDLRTNKVSAFGSVFARKVWLALVEDTASRTPAILAAASKLGVACRGINVETRADTYCRNWPTARASKKDDWKSWFNQKVQSNGSVRYKSPDKKAITDVVLTIGEIVHRVTGETNDLARMELVRMAHNVFFTDPARHNLDSLRECDKANATYVKVAWEGESSDSDVGARQDEGKLYRWLWGPKFFEQVEHKIAEVYQTYSPSFSGEDGSDLLAEGCRSSRFLLYIPWRNPNDNPQLKDFPGTKQLMKTILSVFNPLALPSCDVLQALAPITKADGPQQKNKPYFDVTPTPCGELTGQ